MLEIVDSYLETALWSTIACFAEDDCDETWEAKGYTIDDFSAEAIASAEAECEDFLDSLSAEAREECESHMSRAGHDFWLTREGHGAGFWDGAWKNGTELTKASHAYGEVCMYLGDDERIHFQ